MHARMQVNKTDSNIALKYNDKEVKYEKNESLLKRLEIEGVVRQVFPLHGTAHFFVIIFQVPKPRDVNMSGYLLCWIERKHPFTFYQSL